MAVKKYLQVGTSGFPEEVAASQTSSGAADAGKVVALGEDGFLDSSVIPPTLGADSLSLVAGEALSAGNFVYINSSGQVFKADGSAIAKAAVGFVKNNAANGVSVTVYFEGSNTNLTGLTPGAAYFLSATTPGAASTTVPTATDTIVQFLGRAVSATMLSFEAESPIKRA